MSRAEDLWWQRTACAIPCKKDGTIYCAWCDANRCNESMTDNDDRLPAFVAWAAKREARQIREQAKDVQIRDRRWHTDQWRFADDVWEDGRKTNNRQGANQWLTEEIAR